MAVKCFSILDGELGPLNGNGYPLINDSGADKASPAYMARLMMGVESPDQAFPIPLNGIEMDA